jgi:hypothetical protein
MGPLLVLFRQPGLGDLSHLVEPHLALVSGLIQRNGPDVTYWYVWANHSACAVIFLRTVGVELRIVGQRLHAHKN